MKQLYILDPFEKLHITSDTSILLMNEALHRGHEVYSCTEFDISRSRASTSCLARHHRNEIGESIRLSSLTETRYNLESFDVILIRKDPPFDESYLILLLLLVDIRGPRIINKPLSLLRYNEKLSIFLFPEFITETIVTSSLSRIIRFVTEVGGTVVLKPLYSCSGKDVELLLATDPGLKEIILSATGNETRKIMIQRYLPEVTAGETRIFMLGDSPLAVMKKIPAPGSFKANFDFGAHGAPHILTEKEGEISRAVGAFCSEEDIVLSALDIIAGHLSEFNITSPGLLAESNQVDNVHYEEPIIQFLANQSRK
ncbi:MAG: hypothetical protein RAO92_07040 [Candidatus Euphemobacter frigidus]|nr:hypothetical protein [Candidatus Euphemobacter frigidus]MDP8276142.1 hypothetical protein [Candidatus Euphemobacter frigidus]